MNFPFAEYSDGFWQKKQEDHGFGVPAGSDLTVMGFNRRGFGYLDLPLKKPTKMKAIPRIAAGK